jgi:hypothetical protein
MAIPGTGGVYRMSTWAGECFGVSDRGMTSSVENKRLHSPVMSE